MCGVPRPSVGGAVARIHPVGDNDRFTALFQFNDTAAEGTELLYDLPLQSSGQLELRIHELGDLTTPDSMRKILYSVPLNGETRGSGRLLLQTRLDLGVGGAGIIGRGCDVSFNGTLLGEGVIGWN